MAQRRRDAETPTLRLLHEECTLAARAKRDACLRHLSASQKCGRPEASPIFRLPARKKRLGVHF